ncbi:MAG: MgtC/SapB family protein [Caldilineaceae bacterium]|nr:MgtC/SapB family protein [Caldilineaceae bacterium]MCB0143979.1 MgtC/SapB family protein [Caldilineaceae bacterium]
MSLTAIHWPYDTVFARLALALAIGLFVGIERERRRKDAGLRTFGFVSLLGALGGLLGDNYALLTIGLLGILIVFLNLKTLRANKGTELTTSAAILVIGFAGILSGKGHTLTPAAVGVMTAALLAWKKPMTGFTVQLSDTELRSAILLGILAFVIYPALPEGTVDPWGALEPRAAWVTVILIAGIGFVNYILWKIYGDRGIELTGFLGGLVNSSVATRELAQRAKVTQTEMSDTVYRGILLAIAAMLIRNGVLLALLAPRALRSALLAFVLMLVACVGIALLGRKPVHSADSTPSEPLLTLQSPFSLKSALKFGFILVIIQIAGVFGQQTLGQLGIYVTSLLGGLFSSSSAVAAAAALAAQGTIADGVAGNCAVIASLTSVVVNLPLVVGVADRTLIRRIGWAVGIVALVGVLAVLAQSLMA